MKGRASHLCRKRSFRPVAPWAVACALTLCAAPLRGEAVEKTSRQGPVEVLARLAPVASTIGDSVTLTLRATAEKDVELLMPEFGEALGRFNILDFFQETSVDTEGRTVMKQVYELDPPRSGEQSIPPIMVEFVDRRAGMTPVPDGFDAYEVLTERLPFEVASVVPDDAAAGLHDAFDALPPLATPGTRRWPWILGGTAVTVTAAALWPFWLKIRRRVRRRSACDLALTRLQQLAVLPRTEAAQIDAFFVELSAIVRWYVENRFELRAPESTTEEFLVAMSQSPDLTAEHQPLLKDFLHRADLVKFANFIPTESDIATSIEAARRFLEETRHDAPMLDPDLAPGSAVATLPATASQREVARA